MDEPVLPVQLRQGVFLGRLRIRRGGRHDLVHVSRLGDRSRHFWLCKNGARDVKRKKERERERVVWQVLVCGGANYRVKRPVRGCDAASNSRHVRLPGGGGWGRGAGAGGERRRREGGA